MDPRVWTLRKSRRYRAGMAERGTATGDGPSPYPPGFPAMTEVAPVAPGADGRAPWTRDALTRRTVRVRVNGWTMGRSSWRGLPYMARVAPPLDASAAECDERGVYRYTLDGEHHDHPVGQARLATSMLAGYRLTHDPQYLDRARANCERLLATAVRRRRALYLPYRFTHQLARATIRPTWYSAMAQGLALSAFCRMSYVTREQVWRDSADAVFATFLRTRLPGAPWTVRSDACGHLWLEEYPRPDKAPPLRVLNGHMFSLIGVYDYLWLTGDRRAAVVLDGAATTVADHGPEYRVPGSSSLYCLTLPIARPAYHATHIWQLRRLGTWTGDARFLDLSDLFEQDVPVAR